MTEKLTKLLELDTDFGEALKKKLCLDMDVSLFYITSVKHFIKDLSEEKPNDLKAEVVKYILCYCHLLLEDLDFGYGIDASSENGERMDIMIMEGSDLIRFIKESKWDFSIIYKVLHDWKNNINNVVSIDSRKFDDENTYLSVLNTLKKYNELLEILSKKFMLLDALKQLLKIL